MSQELVYAYIQNPDPTMVAQAKRAHRNTPIVEQKEVRMGMGEEKYEQK